ncbi:hypothetical protein BDI4_660063 [Burkholderia diffusa]|nr:hypothetical protein BDI4_660063 [Burkholderia diffusa]
MIEIMMEGGQHDGPGSVDLVECSHRLLFGKCFDIHPVVPLEVCNESPMDKVWTMLSNHQMTEKLRECAWRSDIPKCLQHRIIDYFKRVFAINSQRSVAAVDR